MNTDQNHRLAVAAAYRQIATEIVTNPSFPVDAYPRHSVVVIADSDAAEARCVRAAAEAMRVQSVETDHCVMAEREFGPVSYEVFAVKEHARKRNAASATGIDESPTAKGVNS